MTKVLLIDDDLLVNRMYQKVFILEKYEVEIAFDGEEGFEKAKNKKPEVILLDIMMPKMNGFELLDKLKLDPETKNMPVIMLTNLYEASYKETALSKGAISYIIKFDNDPRQVVALVNGLLQRYTA